MDLPVCVYLFHQLFGIVFGRSGNMNFHLSLSVGVGFDMCADYKYCLGGKIICLRYLLQNPTEYLVYCLLGKAVPEMIAHCGKVGCFLLQGVPPRPVVGYI